MTIEIIKNRIREGIEKAKDATEKSRFTYHATALNMLLKRLVTTDEELYLALCVDLEKTLISLKEKLEAEGKADTRAPLTRIRRLAEFYAEINYIDVTSMTFSEVMQAAVARKFGAKLWTGEITPLTQKTIKNDFVTYREVAKEIIRSGIEKDPSLWPKVDLNVPTTFGSASKVVRDYITGDSIPCERVPDSRINWFEDFLGLSRNTLLSKVQRKIDHQNRGKKQSEKDLSATNRTIFISNKLSSDLQRVYEEYSAYKIKGIQPELRNISEELRNSRRYLQRAKVQETNRRSNSWTINALGACGSQKSFLSELLFFQDFCDRQLGIAWDTVSSSDLTDPDILAKLVEYAATLQSGGTAPTRILNFVKRGVEGQGYLRFCADTGERSLDIFFEDLDYILEEYPNWMLIAEEGISARGKGGKKGKQNIQFLLNLSAKDRKRAIYKASKFLLERADNLLLQAKQKNRAIKHAGGVVAAQKFRISAASYIRKALQYARVALIQQVSFFSCPRNTNWIELKYFASANKQDGNFASLTWMRQRNRYCLHVPCYGSSLVDDNEQLQYRYLKNADAKNAVDIDVELPEFLTPLIKKYIEIRELYIEYDLMRFGGVTNASDIEMLFPARSIREDSIMDESLADLRERFIESPAKFGESFLHLTYQAYSNTLPEEKQHGINIHAMRHIVAETHLEEHPGDFIGAAAKLNDDVEQIIKTYGDKDRSKAMRRVAADTTHYDEFKF